MIQTAYGIAKWQEYGSGWRYSNGNRLYQEHLHAYNDYGRPEGETYIHYDGNGYWVMDRLGSLHQLPFEQLENAGRLRRDVTRIGHRQ